MLLLVWSGVKTWRLANVAQSLMAHQTQAEELAENGLLDVDPDRAEELVMNLRRDVLVLDRELRPLTPIARRLGWIPRFGPLLKNSAAYLDMADDGSRAAAYAVRGLKPALQLLQREDAQGTDLLPVLLPVVTAAQPDLFAASASLDQFRAARNELVDLDAQPWRVRALIEQIDGKLYLADELKLLAVLPEILGANGPRTYLIMAQNEDEIRATGGFLTGAGRLTLDRGDIVELSFQDGNVVDDWRNKPYDFPPQPLYDLMALELFLFRDANFWPDFPTSAEQAMALYRYGQEQPLPFDGAIAIDQHFVGMLLAVTGPLTVPELESTVNQNNLITSLRAAWGAGDDEAHAEWIGERKDFLGPLAQAIQQKLLNDFDALDPLFLAETMHRAVQEKHLQIYVRDPFAATILDDINWDGRLERPSSGDHLMVVDSNVGYNKANPLVERALQYQVVLSEDDSASARLDIRHSHTGQADADPCEQIVPYIEGITYATLMNQCYWNYLRLYVPGSIDPVQLAQHPLPPDATPAGEGWRNTPEATVETDGTGSIIATPFVLPRGKTLTSTYRYEIPQAVVSDGTLHYYHLRVMKQAGIASYPVAITVALPPGATFEQASPAAVIDGQQITFELDLRIDVDLVVSYRVAP